MHVFDLYRRGLAIVIAVYTVVRLTRGFYRWAPRLAGDTRESRLARGYLTVMLASIRVRRFWSELLQIALLLAVLIGVVYSHRFVLEHL